MTDLIIYLIHTHMPVCVCVYYMWVIVWWICMLTFILISFCWHHICYRKVAANVKSTWAGAAREPRSAEMADGNAPLICLIAFIVIQLRGKMQKRADRRWSSVTALYFKTAARILNRAWADWAEFSVLEMFMIRHPPHLLTPGSQILNTTWVY